jgi:quercetin dioxygenase-like cupin family protein
MTLPVGPDGYLLEPGHGEALWFSGGLFTLKTTGHQTAGGLVVAEVSAPQGAGSPAHVHRLEDEAWYVLDGQLSFWLDGDRFSAGAGAFVMGRRGIEHRFEVTSAAARFLLLLTPAGFEHFARTCGDEATSLVMPPPDLPSKDARLLLAAAEEHGIDIVYQPTVAAQGANK